jgi:hypothetical protein
MSALSSNGVMVLVNAEVPYREKVPTHSLQVRLIRGASRGLLALAGRGANDFLARFCTTVRFSDPPRT